MFVKINLFMSDVVKEIIDDAKDTLRSIATTSRERFKSPLIGPFIIALILYNWRALIILFFSDKTIDCKIAIIDSKYCGWDGVIFPILIAFIYYLILPVIMTGCEALLFPIESYRITLRYLKLEKEAVRERKYQDLRSGNMELQALNNEITNLKLQINQMQTTHDDAIARYASQLDYYQSQTKPSSKIYLGKGIDQENKEFREITEHLTAEFLIKIRNVWTNNNTITKMPSDVYRLLNQNEMLDKPEGPNFVLNEKGIKFIDFINTDYSLK